MEPSIDKVVEAIIKADKIGSVKRNENYMKNLVLQKLMLHNGWIAPQSKSSSSSLSSDEHDDNDTVQEEEAIVTTTTQPTNDDIKQFKFLIKNSQILIFKLFDMLNSNCLRLKISLIQNFKIEDGSCKWNICAELWKIRGFKINNQLQQHDCYGKDEKIVSTKIRLQDLATGPVQLERIEIQKHKKRILEKKVELSFNCHFQELCEFALQLYDQHSENLISLQNERIYDSFLIVQFISEGLEMNIKTVQQVKFDVQACTLFPELMQFSLFTFAAQSRSVGRVSGYIDILSLLKLHQSRDKVQVKPYYRYLYIKVKECTEIIAADTTGYSDVFVVVDLDDSCQMSFDKPENLNSVFNENLYIPVRMGGTSVSKSLLQKKGNILLSNFYQVEVQNEYLGSTEIQLSKTESTNEFSDPIGVNSLAKVYIQSKRLLLTSCGQPSFQGSKIFVSCFCLPNFPSQLHLNPPPAQNP
ncbi:MAG: hypothetical protein EZS28_000060 [Streblomastix strix]|uniref:C2 domain-containing protein n=1 Tax=Streblomastix strix TaxID=222440 RepID=A0A5J4XAS5_9EUKA|nr:MAG: hypothetical protein EZS28_000060 [Streblomastix strix]